MQTSTRLLTLAILAALSTSAAASGPAERALSQLRSNSAVVRGAQGDAFMAKGVIVDADGTEHVRFDRTYRGLPVIGGDFVTHTRNGVIKDASLTLASTGRPGLAGRISADQAILAAGTEFGIGFDTVSDASKVVFARNMSPRLAYEVVFSGVRADQTPTEMHYFVDANNGRILDRWDGIHTGKPTGKGPPGGGTSTTCTTSATGTGSTLTLGSVTINTSGCTDGTFQTKDLTRGGGYTTDLGNSTRGNGTIFSDANNTWGNGSLTDRATVGADAHYGVAETWDYFKIIHGRNGIAGNGVGALSRVHYGRNYVNAFWSDSCFCMTFGDGDGGAYLPLVALDVAGHEMSHGVMSKTANLSYSGESGGLNEANSDIFGTMVEFRTNNAQDTPDYLIGESIYANNAGDTKALRWMYKPSIDNRSPDCYASNLGTLDVHYSSGVANHFFYLLAEGNGSRTFGPNTITSPTCNGSSHAGIGRSAAEKIWYKALTAYMTSSTNYAGARVATLNAARDLYGTGSANYNAVAAAWTAVSVN